MPRPARDKKTLRRPGDPEPETTPPSLKGFIARNGTQSSRVTIHRESDTKIGRWDYVDEINKADLDEAFIKRTYGAGAYKITIMRHDGTIADNIKVSIYGAATPAPTTATAAAGGMSDSVLVAMINNQGAMMTALMTALVGGKNQGPDVAALITALKPNNNPIQDLATLHQLTKGEGGDRSAFALLEKALELGLVRSTVDGGAEGGDGFMTLLREMMPELKGVLRNATTPSDKPALPNPQRRRKPMRPWLAAIFDVREYLQVFAKTHTPARLASRLNQLASPAVRADFVAAVKDNGNDLNPLHAELMQTLGPDAAQYGRYLADTLNQLSRLLMAEPEPKPKAKAKRTK